ncbi:hypothetical protein SAMN05216480_11247 [Pustulibacterium marinum]|uniref:PKD domain-containing protein n=1 Tax=Pustulibacterium marinum TaxID=1224947 RepID=A0A1I7I0Y7_9FLAO|nr:hypothetical protein [Pustulibacterium marinum]SFU66600.1 hypothetical protein SAMN05216480_11247 [Pustulibacterium marinum]
MKKLYKYAFLLAGISLIATSCGDKDFDLGTKLDASDLDFEIIQDYSIDEGGNTIILINNTEETIPVWDYGTGRSTRAIDTIHYAFAGDYTIQFSAMTDGGLVEADPVTLTVTSDNFNYIEDELWENISGGVGNSKTWLLDLDADGVSKYFDGPLYFYGTDNGWLEGGEDGCYGEDCWNWNPEWSGNTWLMDAADFGSMTFSLDGGPYLEVEHLTIPALGSQSGTYYLDPDEYTLSTTDATILHDSGRDACVANWGDIKIFSLTEDTMQLAVLRKDECEGAALLVYNFITQEYSDNWTPEEEIVEPDEGFEPTFEAGELLDILTGGAAAGRYWKLDGSGNPVDWITAGNGWTSSANDSYDWGWNDAWATIASESYIRFDQYGGTQNYLKNENGVETTGTFTINESTNEITLSDDGTLIGNSDSWMTPTAATFTVIKAVPDDFESFGLWFGTTYDASSDQWLAYHYVINNEISGGSGGDPVEGEDTEVDVDNALITYGDIEENGNFRIEIYNEYGTTATTPPVNTSDFVFDNTVEVTFTISGTGVTGDYSTSIYYADSDWSPQGNGDAISVTGDGTYTVSYTPGSSADGCVVFVVDIVGLAADITDLSTVTATVDSIIIN